MSWVRIDDAMPDSLKIAPLSDAAFRAYVTSICYCARSLSDGFVPAKKAKEFASKPKVVKELVPALWEPVEDGYQVHDYLHYNPTRETVLAEREKAKARMQRVRSPEQGANIGGSSPSPSPTPILTTLPDQEEVGSSNGGDERSSPEHQPNDVPPSYPALKHEWENRIGVLPFASIPSFQDHARSVPQAWFMAAIDETSRAPHPSWAYCDGILRNCRNEQRPPTSIRRETPATPPRKSLRYEETAV